MIDLRGTLRPDLYPWTTCPRRLATGELIETAPAGTWSPDHNVVVYTASEDDKQYAASGDGSLVPFSDAVAAAAARGWSVGRTLRTWPVAT